jgi:hypothetical protein
VLEQHGADKAPMRSQLLLFRISTLEYVFSSKQVVIDGCKIYHREAEHQDSEYAFWREQNTRGHSTSQMSFFWCVKKGGGRAATEHQLCGAPFFGGRRKRTGGHGDGILWKRGRRGGTMCLLVLGFVVRLLVSENGCRKFGGRRKKSHSPHLGRFCR